MNPRIQLNFNRYWLYAAFDPVTDCLFYIRPNPARNALSSMFLSELLEINQVDDEVFLCRRSSVTTGGLSSS
jgi:hypothetical protein